MTTPLTSAFGPRNKTANPTFGGGSKEKTSSATPEKSLSASDLKAAADVFASTAKTDEESSPLSELPPELRNIIARKVQPQENYEQFEVLRNLLSLKPFQTEALGNHYADLKTKIEHEQAEWKRLKDSRYVSTIISQLNLNFVPPGKHQQFINKMRALPIDSLDEHMAIYELNDQSEALTKDQRNQLKTVIRDMLNKSDEAEANAPRTFAQRLRVLSPQSKAFYTKMASKLEASGRLAD